MIDKILMDFSREVRDGLLFLGIAGSRAYGTNTENSDYDYRGVFVPSLSKYLLTGVDYQEDTKKSDAVMYTLNKFVYLAEAGNPGLLELLYLPDDCIIAIHPLFKHIRDNRHLFLSRKVEHTYLGYVEGQMHRLRNHKIWVDSPPTEPRREDFGLEAMPSIAQDKLRAFHSLGSTIYDMVGSTFGEYLRKEDKYSEALTQWQKYKVWKTTRNPERFELENRIGYDGKHLGHVCRLLSTAEEIATEHIIQVRRPDAAFLREVRDGVFPYEEILTWISEKKARVKAAFEASDLPQRVDHVRIESLLKCVLKKFFNLP